MFQNMYVRVIRLVYMLWPWYSDSSHSVCGAGCLSHPSSVLKAWRVLESCWSPVYVGSPAKSALAAVQRCCRSRVDEPASRVKAAGQR